MHHYLSMARHNYREHMRDGASHSVKLKKYLYITRPLFCCRWIERDPTAGPPPMPFMDALDAANISAELRAEIDALVARKKAAEEIDEGKAVPTINQFIDTELARLPDVANAMPEGQGDVRALDAFLHEMRSEMGKTAQKVRSPPSIKSLFLACRPFLQLEFDDSLQRHGVSLLHLRRSTQKLN
jgi:predicted nucleotidyltransferase